MSYELERIILKQFFDHVRGICELDNSISESKFMRTSHSKLKAALVDVDHKCTCSRRTWGGPCELCQAGDNEIYSLRNFFIQMRNAKKNGMTPEEIQSFITITKKEIDRNSIQTLNKSLNGI